MPLRTARVARLLGEDIPACESRRSSSGWASTCPARGDELATVPHWRDADVQREADLIEEVARIHGLDKLPTTLPGAASARSGG